MRAGGKRGWGAKVLASAIGAGLLLSACSGSGSGASKTAQSASAAPGAAEQGGTVNWAEQPASAPNCIFPIGPLTCFTSFNASSFQNLLYRPLYWLGKDGRVAINYRLSIGQRPVFSHGNSEVTIHLNHYMWSNGEPVTGRDVVFAFNLVKANKDEWEPYVPGQFPDNVAAITAPNPTTVVLRLTHAFNPTWFAYNELTQLVPYPLAWDITKFPSGVTATSGHLPVPGKGAALPDTTRAGAKAVAAFLEKQAKSVADYTRSPVWRVVDGPWRLQQFTTTGLAVFVPNSHYTGPVKPRIAKFVELPFTSASAEFNQLLTSNPSNQHSGTSLTVGYVPPQDLRQRSRVQGQGYDLSTAYNFAFDFIVVNMQNAKVGHILRQLYIRQALQHLIDQPQWIQKFYAGVAAPTYGPVPLEPPNRFADKFERSNPYPFSIAKARQLLTSHGWDVKPNGLTTCGNPAKCGPGIAKGTPLEFKLLYVSGQTSLDDSMKAFASNASLVGIKLDLSSGPFSTVTGSVVPICQPGKPTTACAWQMLNWGGWVYSGYPSGEDLFLTGAEGNYGGWDSRLTNRLIEEVTTTGEAKEQQVLDQYQNDIARNLPGMLFQPTGGTVMAAAKNLAHYSTNPFGYLDPETWYFTKK